MARPKNLRRGRHRMTPARRAALRKAQQVSARKRRRREIGRAVGKTAVNVGGLFVAARLSSYIAKPSKAKNDYNTIKGLFKKTPQQPLVSKKLKTARMTWIQ